MASQGPGESKPDVAKLKSENGNKNQRRKGRFQGQRNRYNTPVKFKGETDGLDSHAYDVDTTSQAELFTEMTKKLTSYAERNCKEPQDMQRAIEGIKEVSIPMLTVRAVIPDTTLQAKL